MSEAHASTVVLDRADCVHSKTRMELLPQGPHYSRVICEDCGKQLCFRPKPENIERRRRNALNIQTLLNDKRLENWETEFCQGITQNPRLSPRQQALLDRLVDQYLNKE